MSSAFKKFTGSEQFMRVDGNGVTEPITMGADSSLFGTAGTATEAAGAATVNARKGKVTLAAVLNAGAGFEVTLTNSYVTAASVILLSVAGTTATAAATRDALTVNLTSQTAGSCVIQVYNGDAGNSSAAPVVHFLVI
jgi:hypothetical protein